MEQQKCADRRVLWLRKLYLQMCTNYEQNKVIDLGMISSLLPSAVLQAFGGRIEGCNDSGITKRVFGISNTFHNFLVSLNVLEAFYSFSDLQVIISASLQSGTIRSDELTAAKSRLKRITSAVTRRMKIVSRIHKVHNHFHIENFLYF